jgi:hypothetical protein
MPESENRAPQSVFDAEAELQHDETRSGRRRRPVADWGGDELFTRMPRRRSGHVVGQRRFARPDADGAEAQHGGAPERDDWLDGEAQHAAPPERDDWSDGEAQHAAAPERDDWSDAEAQRSRATERGDWLDVETPEPRDRSDLQALDEPAAREPQRTGPEPRRTRPEPPAAPPEPPTAGDDPPDHPAAPVRPAPQAASSRSTGGVPGRRTVVIGRNGRPESPHPEAPFVSVSRRRPPRTVAERIGGQPDRIVGWAFALGLILILVAILTAHA